MVLHMGRHADGRIELVERAASVAEFLLGRDGDLRVGVSFSLLAGKKQNAPN